MTSLAVPDSSILVGHNEPGVRTSQPNTAAEAYAGPEQPGQACAYPSWSPFVSPGQVCVPPIWSPFHKIRRSYVTWQHDHHTAVDRAKASIPGFIKYLRTCEELSTYRPHLRNVFEIPQNPLLGKVHVYNLHSSDDRQLIFGDTLIYDKFQVFSHVLGTQFPSDVLTRLVIVEDLSSLVITALGSLLNVGPEVFEEHLIRAQYNSCLAQSPLERAWEKKSREPEARHWNTASQKRDHLSFWWWRPVLFRKGARPTDPTGMSNILRSNWPINAGDRAYHWRYRNRAVPDHVWEERVTILRCETDLGTHWLVLVDPLPYVYSDEYPHSVHVEVPFVQPTPRLPPLNGSTSVHQTSVDHDQYDRYYRQTASTAESLEVWVSFHNKKGEGLDYRRVVPLLSLISIIATDTRAVLNGIDDTINEITDTLGFHIDVESLVQWDLWRARLHFFTTELPALESRIREFVDGCLPKDDLPPTIRSELDLLLRDLQATFRQCEKLQHSHRMDLSITESSRAIQAAETVTGLTQLAFVFIPLTFAAGLFSINIREFADPPSVSSFVVTCVVLLVSTYSFRYIQKAWPRIKSKLSVQFVKMDRRRFLLYIRGRCYLRICRNRVTTTYKSFAYYLFTILVTFSPPRIGQWLEENAPPFICSIRTEKGFQKGDA